MLQAFSGEALFVRNVLRTPPQKPNNNVVVPISKAWFGMGAFKNQPASQMGPRSIERNNLTTCLMK
jgi:hypothetical protein